MALVRNSTWCTFRISTQRFHLKFSLWDLHFKNDLPRRRWTKAFSPGDDEALKQEDERTWWFFLASKAMATTADTTVNAKHKNVFNHLKITLYNRERKLVLIPKSHKEQKMWVRAIKEMQNATVWSQPHDSILRQYATTGGTMVCRCQRLFLGNFFGTWVGQRCHFHPRLVAFSRIVLEKTCQW